MADLDALLDAVEEPTTPTEIEEAAEAVIGSAKVMLAALAQGQKSISARTAQVGLTALQAAAASDAKLAAALTLAGTVNQIWAASFSTTPPALHADPVPQPEPGEDV